MVVQTSAVLRILFGRNAGWGAQRRVLSERQCSLDCLSWTTAAAQF